MRHRFEFAKTIGKSRTKRHAESMAKRKFKERFTIEEFTNPSDTIAYRVKGTKRTGKRVRENFPTYEVALARQQELLIEFGNEATSVRPKITNLTEEQLRDAERAVPELAPGRTLLDAVRYHNENYREPLVPCSLADGFERYQAEKRDARRRPNTVQDIHRRVGYLKKSLPGYQIAEVQPDHLKDLLKGKKPTNARNYLRSWSAFFGWAVKNKHREDNPALVVEKPAKESPETQILTLAEVVKLLEAARAHEDGIVLPYTVLFLFGGLRHEEMARLRWNKIDFVDGEIRVDLTVAKTRHRRLIQMPRLTDEDGSQKPSNLVEWLTPFSVARKPIVGPTPALWRKHFDAVKRAAGWGTPTKDEPHLRPWVQDIVRHTAISYHFALTQHEGETATWAGNKPDVVHTHYKGLVKAKEAKSYWDLRPDNLAKQRNVIAMRQAA